MPAEEPSSGREHAPKGGAATEADATRLKRRFTLRGMSPFDQVDWEQRDARIVDHRTGEVAFEQLGVEFPHGWSQNATNIVAQKYFRGPAGTPEREWSLRQTVSRVADTITAWGVDGGYFADPEEAETFRAELAYLILTQRMAFNSPVWFNIGVPGVRQQASACFILDVDDTMESILNWYREEGLIFKGGSGAGVNLSKIRSCRERLSAGGEPSGPVSFMRGADASAGTIKSGGTTRRAAKMCILDVGHPDIEEFIWCKAREERKARVLEAAGFDMGVDGDDAYSVQYQNANNSVRVTDDFLAAVEADETWDLRAVVSGEVLERVRARDLFEQLARAAWECADPGVQYDTTINRWNTTPASGRIEASNPCSEHLRLANSACNLASINLLRYLDEVGHFDLDGFVHSVEVIVTAQDILVGGADYPTEASREMAHAARDIGLGYTNLGAGLMALGLAYDSDAGRAWAGAVTAVMTGAAAVRSVALADRLGPAPLFDANGEPWARVYEAHRDALDGLPEVSVQPELARRAEALWKEAVAGIAHSGSRNAELTVLAPTGTISFLMDCDTTGIEPDLSLVKTKKLVGGGTMRIVNQTVPRALRRLGYDEHVAAAIVAHIDAHGSAVDAPGLLPEHRSVFSCSMGDDPISYTGHIQMMAAVQPWISGAISKTVNLPESATVEEVEQVFLQGWKLGLKAVAIYRDNCKVGQPLSAGDSGSPTPGVAVAAPPVALASHPEPPVRERLQRHRRSNTFEFRVADCKGFVTVGEYPDGRPGELFLRVAKQGSTLAGIMDAVAIAVSHGLQYGVPLRAYVQAFVGMRFEPAGMTDDPDLRLATSLMDYLFRRLALDYLPPEERAELGIFTSAERMQPTLPGVAEAVEPNRIGMDVSPDPRTPAAAQLGGGPGAGDSTAGYSTGGGATAGDSGRAGAPRSRPVDVPICMQCGIQMVRSGACAVCPECGTTSGCS